MEKRRRRPNLSLPLRIYVRRSPVHKPTQINTHHTFQSVKGSSPNHDTIFFLPEEMIQQIQSFLGGKEAVRTSVLSKSWYNAWFTRPDLDFNQRDFIDQNQYQENLFWRVANQTLQRYQESNQKIESFKLMLIYTSWNWNFRPLNSVEELIVKAVKMGLRRLEFGSEKFIVSTTLPHIVLESETLIRLSLIRITLDLGKTRKVSCSRLKYLSLDRVRVADNNIIWDIISSCPLIEKLTLSKCFGSQGRLKLVFDGPSNIVYALKCLFLVEVDVDPLFFIEALPMFGCLKDLRINNCGGYLFERIRVCSRSLECISFTQQRRQLKADFDVPSILKFKYSGVNSPSVSFTKKIGWRTYGSTTRSAARQSLQQYRFHQRWVPENPVPLKY